MRKNIFYYIIIVVILTLLGCSDEASSENDNYGALEVTLVNQSEFDIKRIYFHTEIDNYKNNIIKCDSTNISQCLRNKSHSSSVEIDGMEYISKPYNRKNFCLEGLELKYVTFVRDIASTVETEIAITTESPLNVISGKVELNIFAEDFFYTRISNPNMSCSGD